MAKLLSGLLLGASLLLAPYSFAHKVIFDVWPSNGVIEGELGFSNGDMAVNQAIDVLDVNDQQLGSVVTDDDGFFVYTPVHATGHYFVVDLGAGHVGKAYLPVDEFAAAAGLQQVVKASPSKASSAPVVVEKGTTEQQEIMDELANLSADVRQLRKEIRAYKEKNDLQNILGGLGFILGLSGVGYYFAARRKLEQQK